MEYSASTSSVGRMEMLSQCRSLMGTYVEVSVRDSMGDEALLAEMKKAFEAMEFVASRLSFHDPCSELSLLHQEASFQPVEVSDDMVKVLRFALSLSEATEGVYDVTTAKVLVDKGLRPRPSGPDADGSASWKDVHLEGNCVSFSKPLWIDLAGVAKGYVVDCGFSLLDCLDYAVVNAGGDLRMSPWRDKKVQIRDPRSRSTCFVDLPMLTSAVATSAAYFSEGKPPLVNSRRQKLQKDKRSVSVFAPTCMVADALTKVALLYEDASEVLKRFSAESIVLDPCS